MTTNYKVLIVEDDPMTLSLLSICVHKDLLAPLIEAEIDINIVTKPLSLHSVSWLKKMSMVDLCTSSGGHPSSGDAIFF
jgi:hypothetical protein